MWKIVKISTGEHTGKYIPVAVGVGTRKRFAVIRNDKGIPFLTYI
jgi:hypothetical protein